MKVKGIGREKEDRADTGEQNEQADDETENTNEAGRYHIYTRSTCARRDQRVALEKQKINKNNE